MTTSGTSLVRRVSLSSTVVAPVADETRRQHPDRSRREWTRFLPLRPGEQRHQGASIARRFEIGTDALDLQWALGVGTLAVGGSLSYFGLLG